MENGYTPTNNTFRDYLKVLFRQKAVIITSFVTVMLTVIIGTQFKTPVYEASVKVLISAEKQVEAPYYRDLLGSGESEIVLTQSEIVNSAPIIERAVSVIGLYERPFDYEKRFASVLKRRFIDISAKMMNAKLAKLKEEQRKAYLFRMAVEELRRSIRVEPIRDTKLFTISAREFSPLGAAIIANVVSRSYLIFDLEQQLAELQIKYGDKHLAVTQLKDNIEKMQKSLTGEPLANVDAIGPASVKIVEQAQIPIKPLGISNFLTIIIALIMAPFLGVMLAFMFEYMDQSFKSPADVELFLGLPFLGYIPKNKNLKPAALSNLCDQIYLVMKDKGLKSVLFTAASPEEGVTTIVANLARNLSQKGEHKVLLIDANLRNPAIDKAFKITEPAGLADVLEGKSDFNAAAKEIGKNLYVIKAGKTALNPITLLSSHMMQEILKSARERYDLVLIDCVNLKDFKDALVVSNFVDSVVIVVKEGKTRRQVVKSAILPLEQKKTNLIGVIINNRTFVIPKFVYERV
ncbi:MAG: polysaccharide biosynthesis tyrosine autokinase [Candidatus Omnitrophica bacterium]|nr:polysaccharide biosynthesis tyrosine autokinase [Candidatus Omnitrophota bacterium]